MKLKITKMTCNYMKDPVGVDDLPHFSYSIEESGKGAVQKGRRLVVSCGDVVWDSGMTDTDERILIPCGCKLLPETKYTWKVYVKDADGDISESPEASFETGRMKPYNWEAKWITSDPQAIFIGNKWHANTTAPYMRKTFELKETPANAALYICGLGYFECYVNGQSVKDTVLDPAFTEYDKASMYKTYKICNLKGGRNVIAVSLGDGFYNADTDDVWDFVAARWRDHSKCILVLKIKYADGSEESVVSDKTFKGNTGPIVANDVRSSEKYDARRELGDWTSVDYDDSAWDGVTVTKAPGGELIGQYETPMKVVAEYRPAKVTKINKNNLLVDVGFNTVGWAKISFTAPEGTEIILRYSEDFDENLEMQRGIFSCLKSNEKDNFQTDHYIAKGKGLEVWHPIFKYNGFRYINIHCESSVPEDLDIIIQEVRTDLKAAGGFSCSDADINRLQEITCRATITNFHGMPTDCPHREKNGWTGDAQLSAEQLLFNFDGAAAYSRWMDDIIRAQRGTGQLPGIIPSTGWGFNWGSGPAWDAVCTTVPYAMYVYCGDKRIIKKMYPCIKKYIDFCGTMATDDICAFGLGDWCPPASDHKECDLAVTDTAIYYYDIVIASKIAGILGYGNEQKYYSEKAERVRNAFRKRFIKNTKNGIKLINCTKCQTSLACMMYYGLTDKSEEPELLAALKKDIIRRNYHLDVGILGAKYVCGVLLRAGEADLMLKAAMNPEYPSWGFMISSGATTLWENWEGSSSQNHHMFGDISACLFKGVAGIIPTEDKPGFRRTVFSPQFVSMLDHAEAWHETPYGKISCEWKKEGASVKIKISIPADCEGELKLPCGTALENGSTAVELSAGEYEFTAVMT